MKKAILFIVFAALFVVTSPALAAPSSPQVSVAYAPATVYQSEIVEVWFSVVSKGSKPGTWYVEFPKSTVSAIEVTGKPGLVLSENGENYVLTFNLKQLKSQTVAVKLTILSSISGNYPLLSLYNQKTAFVEQKRVEVLVPRLVWEFNIPTEVSAGSTFTGSFTVSNDASAAISLNVNTHFAMYCLASFELVSYPNEAFAGHYFDGLFHQYSWNNYSVKPGETLTWTFQAVAVGNTCGSSADRVFELIDNTNGVVIYHQSILIK